MELVTLKHPKLPDRVIEVEEQRVVHFERSGWKRVGGQPAKTEPAKTAQPGKTESGDSTKGAEA